MSTRIRITLLLAAVALATLGITQVVQDTSPAMPGPPDAGTSFQEPAVAPPQMARPVPLRVDSFDVRRIAEGSHVGAAGDLLVTFWGQGFLLTAMAPRLVVGEDMTLTATEVNADGTQLYVLVTRETAPRIRNQRFEAVTVVNPGGGQNPEYSRVSVPASPAALVTPDPDGLPVRLVYGDGAFRRELVRQ